MLGGARGKVEKERLGQEGKKKAQKKAGRYGRRQEKGSKSGEMTR